MEKLSFVLCHAAINHTPETKILKNFTPETKILKNFTPDTKILKNLKCTSELEPINMMSKCKLTNK